MSELICMNNYGTGIYTYFIYDISEMHVMVRTTYAMHEYIRIIIFFLVTQIYLWL